MCDVVGIDYFLLFVEHSFGITIYGCIFMIFLYKTYPVMRPVKVFEFNLSDWK